MDGGTELGKSMLSARFDDDGDDVVEDDDDDDMVGEIIIANY